MILLAICVLIDYFTSHDQQFYAAQVIEVLEDEEAPELGSRVNGQRVLDSEPAC